MFRRFMIVCWLMFPFLADSSDQEQDGYVSPEGLYCGPLVKKLDGSLSGLNELLDRYESLSDDEVKCVTKHIEICPDFLMRQCKENGWGDGVGGGCEHLLWYDRNFDLQYFIEYCALSKSD